MINVQSLYYVYKVTAVANAAKPDDKEINASTDLHEEQAGPLFDELGGKLLYSHFSYLLRFIVTSYKRKNVT